MGAKNVTAGGREFNNYNNRNGKLKVKGIQINIVVAQNDQKRDRGM